ncbi:MAG: GatB/YqeY domain-containing protein [Bacilli bacterium]|nr:GatB/YqeY domain-containing protein [Bacilli bacterium]
MEININRLIKEVTDEYMPLKLETKGREITVEESEKLFSLSTKLGLFKIIKSLFMEELTKNQELIDFLISEGKITTHLETVKDEKTNKLVEVKVIDQTMEERINLMPEQFSRPIIEKLVKAHKENIGIYKGTQLEKEKYELSILEFWLPKEASREDIIEWLNENFPDGITQKEMGPTIGKAKKAFERADGKLVSECVKGIVK